MKEIINTNDFLFNLNNLSKSKFKIQSQMNFEKKNVKTFIGDCFSRKQNLRNEKIESQVCVQKNINN